jgi:hypothetical protein
MRKSAWVISLILTLSLALGGAVMASGKSSNKSVKLTGEILSVDPLAKMVTFKDEKGESRTFTALGKAAMYIRNLKPGDKAILTCRQNDSGQIEHFDNFKILKK